MRVDNRFHDRQPQSCSFKAIVWVVFRCAGKTLEDPLLVCGGNAFSRVFHPEIQIPVLTGRANGDRIVLLSMTHRILHQVHDGLGEALTV